MCAFRLKSESLPFAETGCKVRASQAKTTESDSEFVLNPIDTASMGLALNHSDVAEA